MLHRRDAAACVNNCLAFKHNGLYLLSDVFNKSVSSFLKEKLISNNLKYILLLQWLFSLSETLQNEA